MWIDDIGNDWGSFAGLESGGAEAAPVTAAPASVMDVGASPNWLESALNKTLDFFIAKEAAESQQQLPGYTQPGYVRVASGQVVPAGTMAAPGNGRGEDRNLILLAGLGLIIVLIAGRMK